MASALNTMGRSEPSSRRKPTADLGGGPASGLRNGGLVNWSVVEFERCATNSGEPLLCILTSSCFGEHDLRRAPRGAPRRGKYRSSHEGFLPLTPSGVVPKYQGGITLKDHP